MCFATNGQRGKRGARGHKGQKGHQRGDARKRKLNVSGLCVANVSHALRGRPIHLHTCPANSEFEVVLHCLFPLLRVRPRPLSHSQYVNLHPSFHDALNGLDFESSPCLHRHCSPQTRYGHCPSFGSFGADMVFASRNSLPRADQTRPPPPKIDYFWWVGWGSLTGSQRSSLPADIGR